MKKWSMALVLCLLIALAAPAAAQITVTRRDLALNQSLDRNVSNILVLMQDGEVTDTMTIASINSRTGRSVMTRIDCALPVEVTMEDGSVQSVPVGQVYGLGDEKSRGLLVCRELNELLELNIGTYIALDIAKLPQIVEAVGTLRMQVDEDEAQAMGTWVGINELTGEGILDYVRLKLPTDSPARSRGYDALMQLLYQGLHSGNVMDMMGLGKQLLASMDTNLSVMTAMTLVSAAQAGDDRRELLISGQTEQEARALAHREIYE